VKAEQGWRRRPRALELEQYVRLSPSRRWRRPTSTIVNAVDFLFTYAFDRRRSDIHSSRGASGADRFRIDGLLHTIHQCPSAIQRDGLGIKMLSRLDIAERRRP